MEIKDLKKKKKILHITHSLGGVETYLRQVLQHNDSDHFEHVIAAPYNKSFQHYCRDYAIYYPLKTGREIRMFSDLVLLVKLIRLIRKEKPQVIHTHSAKGGFLGRIAGMFSAAGVIYTPHGFSYLSFTGMKRVIFFTLERLVLNKSNLLLAVSESEAARARFELGYRPEKIKVILNAVNPTQNNERDFNNNYRIGMIGRLTIQKNPMLFMEIAGTLLKKYPKLEFKILGAGLDDHLGTELNDFIIKYHLGAKIQILPWGDHLTGESFLRSTDIFVMTSVFEGLSYSLLEAMEQECACVVSKADGNNDVIQHNENGFSCMKKEEFCAAISLLIDNKKIREDVGKAARLYVHNNHSAVAASYMLEKVYSSLLR